MDPTHSAPANPPMSTTTTTTQPLYPQLYTLPSSSPSPSPAHSQHNVYDGEQYSEYHHYAPRTARGSKGSSRSRAHDSVMSHPMSPKSTYINTSPPSPTLSTHTSAPISFPPRAYLDPEKAAGAGAESSPLPHSLRSPRVSASNPDVTAALYDTGKYHEKGPEDKPLQLLLFLSGPCALLSLLIAIWTLVALLISALLQPFRLFSSRSSSAASLTTFLAPPLNLQLHLIYSYATSTEYSSPMLVVIHLISPFVAIGVALAAWTAAFFSFFSAILGDPAGQDGHNDGKESILGVRNWWEKWLSRALR